MKRRDGKRREAKKRWNYWDGVEKEMINHINSLYNFSPWHREEAKDGNIGDKEIKEFIF